MFAADLQGSIATAADTIGQSRAKSQENRRGAESAAKWCQTAAFPDGSKVVVTGPQGSDVDVRDSSAAGALPATDEVGQRDESMPTATEATFSLADSPLAFAIVVDEDQIAGAEQREAAEQQLLQADSPGPVSTPLGTWCPVANKSCGMSFTVRPASRHRDFGRETSASMARRTPGSMTTAKGTPTAGQRGRSKRPKITRVAL